MKGDDRLIYAVVGTRRGGGGGGGGVKGGVPRTRCCSGVGLWGCLFGVRLSCMSVLPLVALYDRGHVRCCQGGIFGNMTADVGRGGSRLRGNDVMDTGNGGMGADMTGWGAGCVDGRRTGGSRL